MCAKKLMTENKINLTEYNYFLKGGVVFDRSTLPDNANHEWLSDQCWDNICQLTNLSSVFSDMVDSLNQNGRSWKQWFLDSTPESLRLPGDWDNKLNEFQKMIVLRALRPDRVVFATKTFISNNLGPEFVQPPSLDLSVVLKDSSNITPIIFVLSSGSDPTQQLMTLANSLNKEVYSLSLGAGQDKPATKMLEKGIIDGNWVFFANCHLSISWMPVLEQLIENYCSGKSRTPHKNFRLWLSCKPHPKFPITILQRSLKITNEPPSGLKMNLKRIYSNVSVEQLESCSKPHKFKKLLFCLVWFHSLLLERRKFGSLGWNIGYSFTDSDFTTSSSILSLYLARYDETPWDALRYLIAQVNYGGRVTDNNDRRLISVYVEQFFNDQVIDTTNYQLCDKTDFLINTGNASDNENGAAVNNTNNANIIAQFFVPDDGSLKHYMSYIESLPSGADHPGLFGQHPNADMSSHTKESNVLLDTLLSFEAATASGSKEESMEQKVLRSCEQLLEQVPDDFDIDEISKKHNVNDSPLTVVMFQEIERYNQLLHIVKTSLISLQKGMQGLIVISAEIEQVCNAVNNGKVPALWKSLYPSLKPLSTWTLDLILRIEQLQQWSGVGKPKVFWLSGFTFPTGFLTALLQSMARRQGIAIDHLSWEFNVINNSNDFDGETIAMSPKEGAYIRGLFLEGAGWDIADGCLCDAPSMKLNVRMPVIHFKPIDKKKTGHNRSSSKSLYNAPLYIYPIRTGTRENPSFVTYVDLKSGKVNPNTWSKRGAALLLSLAQ